MTDQELQIPDPRTRTALENEPTLRIVLKAKYRPDKSRRSADVIPWAEKLAESVSRAALKEVGKPNADFEISLNIIQMLGSPDYVYICYDIFRAECDRNVRLQTQESLQQPIHYASRRGGTYLMRKDARIEAFASRSYSDMRKLDKGELPLFSDLKFPPCYIFGKRMEEQGRSQEEWQQLRAERKKQNAQSSEGDKMIQGVLEKDSEGWEHDEPDNPVPREELQRAEPSGEDKPMAGGPEEKSEDRQHDKPPVGDGFK
ncbi:hypothetical protein N7516_001016 [Penicillium verrucosum]|uniref:uncharacterized protein n=1 Tax=Penicillium verrucosum TaxID=60171 RepID=UPI002545540C|nr:uncharacterized protein N7516_001016 [Penicillium verrucosum]KAJ5940848.1 hypothetical protein N7516_001016 [Penicillium verrucosum]